MLYASVELVAHFWGIDRRANGDDLCPRHPFTPLVQFGYLGAASHDLKGVTFAGKISGIDDALTAVDGCREFPSHHLPQQFERKWPIGLVTPGLEHRTDIPVFMKVLMVFTVSVFALQNHIRWMKAPNSKQNFQGDIAPSCLDDPYSVQMV
ncbi:MAG: hypothetical protein V3S55_06015, partial [Nitrospiraceae bacterium]